MNLQNHKRLHAKYSGTIYNSCSRWSFATGERLPITSRLTIIRHEDCAIVSSPMPGCVAVIGRQTVVMVIVVMVMVVLVMVAGGVMQFVHGFYGDDTEPDAEIRGDHMHHPESSHDAVLVDDHLSRYNR